MKLLNIKVSKRNGKTTEYNYMRGKENCSAQVNKKQVGKIKIKLLVLKLYLKLEFKAKCETERKNDDRKSI